MIACIYIPHFIAAIRQRENSSLDRMPFVVFETDSRFRRIVSTSHEAAQAGVRLGMTLRQAETECGDLLAVPANTLATRRSFEMLLETLSGFTLLVEPEVRVMGRQKTAKQASISGDEDAAVVYLDLGKLREEEGYDAAAALHSVVKEQLQLEAAIALSSGKFTARVIATSLTPREVMVVPRGKEAAVLADYPATLLPLYPEEAWRLSLLGLKTLGDIAALPASAILDLFGKQGRKFHQFAKGRDTSPVLPYEPPLREMAVSQLDPPVDDRAILENELRVLVEALAHRLERQGKVAQETEVVLALEDGSSRSSEITLQQPSGSPVHLSRTVIDLLAAMQPQCRITELEVTLSGIQTAQARQLSLFEPEGTPQDRLRAVLKNLIARHGSETFYLVDLSDPEALLPERGFTLKRLDEV